MPTLSSPQTGANEAEETTSRLASRDAHKGPAGQGRLWTASRGVVSAAPSRGALASLTRTVDSLPGATRGHSFQLRVSPEKKQGCGPSSFPGPRVPRARSAHPESPPRGRAPKGPSGGPNILPARESGREFFRLSILIGVHPERYAAAGDGLSTAERLTPGSEPRQKEGPAGVSSSAGPRHVLYPPNVTLWPSSVNCSAQVRGARSLLDGEAPRKGACAPR